MNGIPPLALLAVALAGCASHIPDPGSLLLAGDTVWVREGYEQRAPMSWLASSFDGDGAQNDRQIARLWALHQAMPALTILPAHDRRQWEAVFGSPGCLSSP